METTQKNETLKKFSTMQLLYFCLGFFGLQFAWQMRIILSGPVTEELGASPFLFGLIWLAGPFTGMVVQPLIGALSDKTKTPLGRRRPYLLGGALLSALALCLHQIRQKQHQCYQIDLLPQNFAQKRFEQIHFVQEMFALTHFALEDFA